MDNKKIARILRETADLLQIDGAIIGRYRSYEKAADLIESLPQPVEQMVETPEKLLELPGIGQGMMEHLTEIVKTGDYSLRQKLLKKYPATLLDVLMLQSLGPKKAALLWKQFKAGSVDDVERLAKEGKLRDLAGFGEKSEQNILRAVEAFKKLTGRFLISTAELAARGLRAHIMKMGKINKLPWYARLGIFGAVAVLVYAAFWYFVTSGTRKDTKNLQDQIATLKKANAEMQIVSQRLNEFRTTYKNKQEELEKKLTEINNRIDAIQKLRASQQGPSAVLAEIKARFDSVPGLYLKSVEQKDAELTIKGESPNEGSVTRFGQSMEFSSGLFSNLNIETTRQVAQFLKTPTGVQAQPVAANGILAELPEVVAFTIKCDYGPAKPPEPATPTQQASTTASHVAARN